MAMNVLPTPPFPLATAMIEAGSTRRGVGRGAGRSCDLRIMKLIGLRSSFQGDDIAGGVFHQQGGKARGRCRNQTAADKGRYGKM